MAKLTARKAQALTKPGLYSDGETLFLRVAAGGSKQWIQRIRVKGKRHDIGIGPFPLVSIGRARIEATRNRLAVWEGRDPLAEKRAKQMAATVPTFAAAQSAVLEAKAATWKGGADSGTAKQWRQSMDRYALPAIGDKRLDRVAQADVLAILTPIWTKRPAVARKLRQRLVSVFEYGTAHGHISSNPAGEAINGALPRTVAVKRHNRALPYGEVAATLDAVETFSGSLAARLALRLTILTAARNGEVRAARWDEFDIDAATWIVPAERMKTGREHRIPLSGAALETIERARTLDDGSGLVFPSPMKRGRPLSNMTLAGVLKSLGLADRATVHGFRSSFRDWCADTGKPREIAEAALAHTVGGTEGAYFRSDLFARRRRLMDSWAAFVTGQRGDVVALHGT